MIIYKGEDKKIELTLQNDECFPIDIDTLLGLSVVVYQKGIELAKYNTPSMVDFDDITVVSSIDGVIQINLQSAQTLLGKVNKDIFVALKLQTIQATFDNGTFDSIIEGIKIGKLANARTKSFNP